MKIFVHTKKTLQSTDWKNEPVDFLDFTRVPIVGEYFILRDGGPWYQVRLVVHIPLPVQTEFQAEVYAIEVDHVKAVNDACFDPGAK